MIYDEKVIKNLKKFKFFKISNYHDVTISNFYFEYLSHDEEHLIVKVHPINKIQLMNISSSLSEVYKYEYEKYITLKDKIDLL